MIIIALQYAYSSFCQQAESAEARSWMLADSCIGDALELIGNLLLCDNLWTASNAALVLARSALLSATSDHSRIHCFIFVIANYVCLLWLR